MDLNIAAILNLIRYTGVFSHLLPLVFFLLYKRHSKDKSLWVIFYYIIYCILNEIVGYYLHIILSELSFILFAVFTIVELAFFCFFYYYILLNANAKARKFVFPIWLCFFIISIIDFFFVNKMDDFDSFPSGLQTILIISMCVYYLFLQIKGTDNLYVYSTANFWIIITFLIYVSGTFFLYIMTETMKHNRAFQIQYLVINSIFNILKNVLLSIAMVMKSSQVAPELKKNYERNDYNPVN